MEQDNIVFNQFVDAMEIEQDKDYIIRYKSELTDPNCLHLSELQFLYNKFKSNFPNSSIFFIPDSLELEHYNQESLLELKSKIETLLWENKDKK